MYCIFCGLCTVALSSKLRDRIISIATNMQCSEIDKRNCDISVVEECRVEVPVPTDGDPMPARSVKPVDTNCPDLFRVSALITAMCPKVPKMTTVFFEV